MNLENNITLITNDTRAAKILKPRLVLLRDIDNINITNYSDAVDEITKNAPETIILHCNYEQKDALELIKAVKKICDTPIMLVLISVDQDFILNAYDAGISDYITLDAGEAEILMRTIWCLKKNELSREFKKHYTLLEQLDVISPLTGFYSTKHYKQVFENEFDNIRKNNIEAIFMSVSPDEDSKTKLSQKKLAEAIKKSIRNSDVASHGAGNKFFILLLKTNLKGAFTVWERIKHTVGESITINAGICAIDKKPFEDVEKEVTNALCEAISTKNDVVVADKNNDASSDNWLDKINSSEKNFKLFKQAFSKKLDKVITPVFFQMQKAYEEKLFKTEIEQYSNSTLSAFCLKKENQESELKITYPGFSKINIDITHQGLDSPENKRISLDLTELTEHELTKILEDFIKDFKNAAND